MNLARARSDEHATRHLYGIPNCDTVKKARTWLTEHGVDHQFHDFKKLGVPADQLAAGLPPWAGKNW